MKRVWFAAVVVGVLGATALGCGGEAAPPPDPITRELPGAGASPPDVAEPWDDTVDAGPPDFDGGICCPVDFALPVNPGELEADLVVGASREHYPLTPSDGVWTTEVCMPLVDTFYFYEVRSETDDPNPDAGLFVTARVNYAVPIETGGLTSQLNLFLTDGAMACEDFDASVHSSTGLQGEMEEVSGSDGEGASMDGGS